MQNQKMLLILSTVFVLLLTGCGREELAPFQTISSGSYQITLLAPGGFLKTGNNAIAVQVSQNGQPVGVQQAELMLSMPQMGAMPYMETHAQFVQTPDDVALDGTVRFTRGGRWNGKIQLTTPGGPVNGTFDIHVGGRE